jgi:alpha-galactosidase
MAVSSLTSLAAFAKRHDCDTLSTQSKGDKPKEPKVVKIAIIGAGSTVFMKNIVTDIVLEPGLESAHIALHDIDAERLAVSEKVARRICDTTNTRLTISASLNRREALQHADFVITMIQVGGYNPATVIDFDIPKKYGLRQTIGDTLGIGGIMRGIRTVPVLRQIADDMADCCPDALLLQYVNPMAINCLALSKLAPQLNYIGLCHSVQGTAIDLARDLGEKPESIDYDCAGINHVAFYTRFEKRHADGRMEDLYPRLRQLAQSREYGRGWEDCANHVRYDMLTRLGYFVTESSEHFAEYTPYFIKSNQPQLIDNYEIPLDEYPRRCEAQIAEWEAQAAALTGDDEMFCEKSVEYAARIIGAMTQGRRDKIHGNLANRGLIDNLPENACVEVPCLVDEHGVVPQKVGALPPHLTALMQTNINVQQLTVEALVTGQREHVYHAAMLDPHTAAELNLDQIWALVDEMLDAHGEAIPELR